jgi:3-hydroxymyristoyl/3-hydroxydecanoyl-(acyl carrier protein) dehydratase
MFPGTLVVEALAQASGLMMNIERLEKEGVIVPKLEEKETLASLPEIPLSVLAESHIKQHSLASPGETIFLQAAVAMQRAEFRYFKVEARTDSRIVATGTILLSYPHYM